MPLDIGGGYGSSPRKAVESQAGRIRRVRSLDVVNPKSNQQLVGKRLPSPLDEVRAVGAPQRPKIRVEDTPRGREFVISAYHAQPVSDPEITNPRKGDVIHAGTLRASRHRASSVIPGTETGYDASVRPFDHRLYHIEARVPEDEFVGSRSPISDYHANQLVRAYRGEGVAHDTESTFPRETRAAVQRRLGAIGYGNEYEDPGSISYALSGDKITGFRRLYDAATPAVGLMSLLGAAAQFVPGFAERMPRTNWLANGGPLGDVMQGLIERAYAPGGPLDPYRNMRNMAGFNPQTGTVPA